MIFLSACFCEIRAQEVRDTLVLSKSTLEELVEESPYDEYLEVEDDSMNLSGLQHFFDWFVSKLVGNKVSYGFMRMLPYLIILIVVVLIALKVSGLSVTRVFKPQGNINANHRMYSDDAPIQSVNFTQLISIAVADNDYRLAIRYSYLQLLQELDKKELIQWEKHKSNYDYIMATRKRSFFTSFVDLTGIYENAWYGEFPWSDAYYKEVFERASQLTHTISNTLK